MGAGEGGVQGEKKLLNKRKIQIGSNFLNRYTGYIYPKMLNFIIVFY